MELPSVFCDKVIQIWGQYGRNWLENLPDLVRYWAEKWQLSNCRIVDQLSIQYVCLAHSDQYGDVVFKTGVPHPELYTGMDTLQHFKGKSVCTIYEMDRQAGVMLLERVFPGTNLRGEDKLDERLRIGANLAKELPTPIDGVHGFPTLQEQLEKAFTKARRERKAGEDFLSMLHHAEALHKEIQQLERPKLLLHGDLHHENILKDAFKKWKAIDPQGRIGELCLEVGRFLRNEWHWFGGIENPEPMAYCIDFFSKTMKESPRIIAASCFIDCALSGCWSLEDGGGQESIDDNLKQMKRLLEFLI